MASDQLVAARLVLQAQLEVERRGADDVTRELEQVEPDLAEYAIERLCDVHRRLLDLRGRPRASERLYAQIRLLLLSCVTALRKGHFDLWTREQAGTPLEGLDPPPAPPPRGQTDDGL